jgi:hypothetical protein
MSRRLRAACCPFAPLLPAAMSSLRDLHLCTCALQLKVRQLWAEVEYTVTGEVEQLDLGELINDGQIAIGVVFPSARRLAVLAP